MALPNIFTKEATDQVIARIDRLTPETSANWGKMNVAQMLAHCNVTYELVYDNIHPRPNGFMRFILKSFVKKSVVNEVPYTRNQQTAPVFVVTDQKVFEAEKKRLIDYIGKTQELGESHFDQKESHSFGALNKVEWSNMFYKHLDHHLTQFGAV